MGTSNINDIKNDQGKKRSYSRQKRSYPKRSNISTTYKLFFFTILICVYGYPIFYFLGGSNAPTFFKLNNRLLKQKTFSGRKCQNKFTYLNTIQKKSLQQLSLIQKSFRDGIFHCDSQLFGRLMYVFIFKIYSTQISRIVF